MNVIYFDRRVGDTPNRARRRSSPGFRELYTQGRPLRQAVLESAATTLLLLGAAAMLWCLPLLGIE